MTELEQLEQRIDALTVQWLDVIADPAKTAEDAHALAVAVHKAEDEQRELRRRQESRPMRQEPANSGRTS